MKTIQWRPIVIETILIIIIINIRLIDAAPSDGYAGEVHNLELADGEVDTFRTVDLFIHSNYSNEIQSPLVVLLHGLGQNANETSAWMKMKANSDDLGFLYVAPDAKYRVIHRTRKRTVPLSAWCADTACCCGQANCYATNSCNDDYNLDSAFLRRMIEHILENYNVDRNRIYVIGISNGAHMAYRLACDHHDLIAGVMAICGKTNFAYDLDGRCEASSTRESSGVHLLHIHGTADRKIPYYPYPKKVGIGIKELVARWAENVNSCSDSEGSLKWTNQTQYLTPASGNNESAWGKKLHCVNTNRYLGCRKAHTELWTIPGVGHCPGISYANMKWLLDKRKGGPIIDAEADISIKDVPSNTTCPRSS